MTGAGLLVALAGWAWSWLRGVLVGVVVVVLVRRRRAAR